MGVEYKDYYKLLGVSRNATKDEISKAYKKLARQYHPDLNPGDKSAEDKFKDINEAYEVLKDAEKRKFYDQLGPNWQQGQNFQQQPGFEGFNFNFQNGGGQGFDASGFSDFFDTLFGGAGKSKNFGNGFNGFSQKPRRGRDIEAELAITLEEAYKGGKKNISLRGHTGNKTLEVNVPAGIKEGARIRLAGQGDPGQGGAAGDLFLRITLLPHSQFALDGNDLVYTLQLAPWEAALGATVRVPTLEGEVDITVPAGISGGKKLRLRGRGLGSGSAQGDEFVKINIRMPEKLTDEEKKLWQQLAEVSSFKARN